MLPPNMLPSLSILNVPLVFCIVAPLIVVPALIEPVNEPDLAVSSPFSFTIKLPLPISILPPDRLAPLTLPSLSTMNVGLIALFCMLVPIIVAPVIVEPLFISPVKFPLLAVNTPSFVTLKFSPIVIEPLVILQLPSWSTVKAL